MVSTRMTTVRHESVLGRDVGPSLKRFARLYRFHHALAMLRRPGPDPRGLVAAEVGYFDQAHLNRDVRAFAGCSPGEPVAAPAPDDTTVVMGLHFSNTAPTPAPIFGVIDISGAGPAAGRTGPELWQRRHGSDV